MFVFNYICQMDCFVFWDSLPKNDTAKCLCFLKNAYAWSCYFYWLFSFFTVVKNFCKRASNILLDSLLILLWKLFSVYFNDLSQSCNRSQLLCCLSLEMVISVTWEEKCPWTMTGSVDWLAFCESTGYKLWNAVSQVLCICFYLFFNGTLLASWNICASVRKL